MDFEAHHNDALRLATMIRMAEEGKLGARTLAYVGGVDGLREAHAAAVAAAALDQPRVADLT